MLYGIYQAESVNDLYEVLILIFLENALRLCKKLKKETTHLGLNPYFFGKCSTAINKAVWSGTSYVVLILIFLENALRLGSINPRMLFIHVLILIFLENALRRINYI